MTMKIVPRAIAALARHRFALPALYAVTVVGAILAGDWLIHNASQDPGTTRLLGIVEDIVFALVTGVVVFSLFAWTLKSAAGYRALARGTRDLIFFVGSNRTIVDANDAAIRTYGWTRNELLGRSFKTLCADESIESCAVESVLAGCESLLVDGLHRRRDGAVFPVEVSATRGEIDRKPVVLIVARDISERRRREGFATLLHDIDRAILRGEPIDSILGFVSKRLAALFPDSLVQISLKGEDGAVDIRQFAGEGTDFLEGIQVRWDDTPAGRGPTGRAIRTGEIQFSHLDIDPDFMPWRARAVALGFKLAAAVPLVAHGHVLGALTLFTRPGVLDETGVAALQGFADQVAISVHSAQTVVQLELQRVALESAANAVVVTDRAGAIRWVNPAFTKLTGWTSQEVFGKTTRILKSGNHGDAFYREMWARVIAGDVWQGELYNRRKDGTLYLEEQTITPVRASSGEITHFVAIKLDITARKHHDEQIRYLAMHDALTDLPNRRLLAENLVRVVHQAHRGRPSALMIIDVDNFKVVNDSLGHAAGDHLLKQLRELIVGSLRPGDFVARFGGDEFAVLVEGSELDDAVAAAERLRENFEAFRFRFGEHQINVGASVGITPVKGDIDAETLMVQADSALYAAKEQGKNRVVVYHEGVDWSSRLIEAGQWAARIREALRSGGFELAYQPVVCLKTGRVDHYEALVRLRGEDGELIMPNQFLRAAERFGLMPQIDRWVIEAVTDLLSRREGFRVFVNLAAASLADEALLDFIAFRLHDLRIGVGRLAFEITEATAITDVAAAQNWIRRVKELGCLFALDDFGVGFSSLAYLRALAVDYVKIDRSFVADIHIDATSRALVQAVKTVALTLGKEVIAEGVECEEHAVVLRDIGVENGQGFLWGLPSGKLDRHGDGAGFGVPSDKGALGLAEGMSDTDEVSRSALRPGVPAMTRRGKSNAIK